MKKNFLKQNKGISMTDIVISIIILSLFVGLIGQMYYSISLNNLKIRSNAIATSYTVKLAEDIDKMAYGDVTKEKLEELLSDREKYDYPDSDQLSFRIGVEVKNYKEEQEKQGKSIEKDVIKIVEITTKYNTYGEEQTYLINKLKIKENNL